MLALVHHTATYNCVEREREKSITHFSRSVQLVCNVARSVNWKTAKSTNHCKTGDIISCSGHGRVEVENIEKTKKGKYAVELARYV